jgi:hypothetical protein
MSIELITALIFVIAAVDVDRVRISSHIWVDIPCRLILALMALGIVAHSIKLHRDAGAARN